MRVKLGKLHIEAFAALRRVGPVWVPDGLHVWWGGRGIHLSLFGSPRVEHDRLPIREAM